MIRSPLASLPGNLPFAFNMFVLTLTKDAPAAAGAVSFVYSFTVTVVVIAAGVPSFPLCARTSPPIPLQKREEKNNSKKESIREDFIQIGLGKLSKISGKTEIQVYLYIEDAKNGEKLLGESSFLERKEGNRSISQSLQHGLVRLLLCEKLCGDLSVLIPVDQHMFG